MEIIVLVIPVIGFVLLLVFLTTLGRIAAATERIARALEDKNPE